MKSFLLNSLSWAVIFIIALIINFFICAVIGIIPGFVYAIGATPVDPNYAVTFGDRALILFLVAIANGILCGSIMTIVEIPFMLWTTWREDQTLDLISVMWRELNKDSEDSMLKHVRKNDD